MKFFLSKYYHIEKSKLGVIPPTAQTVDEMAQCDVPVIFTGAPKNQGALPTLEHKQAVEKLHQDLTQQHDYQSNWSQEMIKKSDIKKKLKLSWLLLMPNGVVVNTTDSNVVYRLRNGTLTPFENRQTTDIIPTQTGDIWLMLSKNRAKNFENNENVRLYCAEEASKSKAKYYIIEIGKQIHLEETATIPDDEARRVLAIAKRLADAKRPLAAFEPLSTALLNHSTVREEASELLLQEIDKQIDLKQPTTVDQGDATRVLAIAQGLADAKFPLAVFEHLLTPLLNHSTVGLKAKELLAKYKPDEVSTNPVSPPNQTQPLIDRIPQTHLVAGIIASLLAVLIWFTWKFLFHNPFEVF